MFVVLYFSRKIVNQPLIRYKIALASSILLGALPANILIVNVIGSFILGVFFCSQPIVEFGY